LHRSVDLFDVKYGFAFSTYATQSIYRNIAKDAFQDPKEIKTKNIDSQFETYEDKCTDPKDNVDNRDLNECLKNYMVFLTPKERIIVNAFYGIDRDRKTLTEIGRDMKISKEFVRQTREKALMKLRTLMKEDTVIGNHCK
jgi:RNA polymerase sigma factor (sigma-70 family)